MASSFPSKLTNQQSLSWITWNFLFTLNVLLFSYNLHSTLDNNNAMVSFKILVFHGTHEHIRWFYFSFRKLLGEKFVFHNFPLWNKNIRSSNNFRKDPMSFMISWMRAVDSCSQNWYWVGKSLINHLTTTFRGPVR